MTADFTIERIALEAGDVGIKGVLALVLLTAATGALAGNTGTEFQSLYTWLTGMVQGYFGKAAAIAAIGLGALFSLARLNPMPILSGGRVRGCSCNTHRRSRPAS